ncbi:hypothetical protein GCM10009560_78270 [Nonomuraea longicatena]|uniref:Uncharacterized protein n=1 Tax=Nonomuraea longicatena TaxID=83682 RepID=A0ABN1RB94_9ACTN
MALLKGPDSLAQVCDEALDVKATGSLSEMSARKGSDVAMTAEALAKQAGLPGLSKASAVLSFTDLGGVAAAAGLPALPEGVPGEAGLPDVRRMATVPSLPDVGSLTQGKGLPLGKDLPLGDALPLSKGLPLSEVPSLPGTGALPATVKEPLRLGQSVGGITDKVGGNLPTSKLPLSGLPVSKLPLSKLPVSDGKAVDGLVKGLKLP